MLLPAFVSFKRLQVNIICVNSNERLRLSPFHSSSGYALQLRHAIRCQAYSYVGGRRRPEHLEVQAG